MPAILVLLVSDHVPAFMTYNTFVLAFQADMYVLFFMLVLIWNFVKLLIIMSY